MPNSPPLPLTADKVNILLVDDQPGKLLTYETILAGLGENLVKATHGQEALHHLLKAEFAVVLLDVCMPVIDGFALASMIRQHPRCERTSIIFISAVQMDDGDQLKGYELGGVDYMSVPVVPELLRARVSVFCDLYRKTRALERVNRELEQRVAERTADLEKDLAERKRLEQALIDSGRRKDEFLAVLAHELRNPLAPIRTAVDLLRLRPIEDPLVLECRDVIDRQVEQLTSLVDDLLDVSRISSGKIKLAREPLDVGLIVDRAVETQRPVLDARRQKLSVLKPEQALVVHGDLTRLSEAVGNLLNNASKYSDEGALIVVRLEAGRSADGAPEAVIRVQDPGIGIPPDEVERVFELFTQLSHAAPRAQGGIGVGLALVRKLVDLHGGQVAGRSAGLGRGSEFEIRLPLETAAQAAPAARAPVAAAAAMPQRRVLVVDDNRDAAETLAAMLRLDGQDVRTAHDGTQALALAEQFRPELVLLDLGMPGVSGFDVARGIRARPWGASVVLVAQTGWGQEHDRRRTREAGFDEHVTKPVERARLLQLLAQRAAEPETRRAAG
jgi:signal transduction histidine kinase/ActR/RegA family two-component response regulator